MWINNFVMFESEIDMRDFDYWKCKHCNIVKMIYSVTDGNMPGALTFR